MTDWPLTLPTYAQISSLNGEPDDSVLRTSGDIGPLITRNRYTATSDYYTFTMMMTLAQFEIFKTFYKTTLGNGSLPFNFRDPVHGTTREFVFSTIYKIISIEAVDSYLIQLSIISEPE